MKDKQRKKAQRSINKAIREMNQNIAADSLWRGRFVGRQKRADWYRFSDGSGGILTVTIEFRDKKTNQTDLLTYDNYDIKFHGLFIDMNEFIIETCYENTWKNRDELYSDTTDYTKVR